MVGGVIVARQRGQIINEARVQSEDICRATGSQGSALGTSERTPLFVKGTTSLSSCSRLLTHVVPRNRQKPLRYERLGASRTRLQYRMQCAAVPP